jgi:hypothetical protein
MRQTSESPAGSHTLTIGSVGGLLKEDLYEQCTRSVCANPAPRQCFSDMFRYPSNRLRGSNPFCDA